MKFLIVGLGSMGKRRIRNLHALGEHDIIGHDSRLDRRREAESLCGIRTCETFDEGMASDPDAVIISTPPDQHAPYALTAARHGKHFFSEVSVPDDRWIDVENESKRRNIVAAPSCTIRFHPAIKKAKEILSAGTIGDVLAFTHHFGEYLARWHPWEDYRDFYVSRRHTGACREIVTFELIWITWLCGDVETISCFKGRVGDLGVDIDDVYQLILQFRSRCIGHLQVDALQRVGYRHSRFVCSKGVIAWDWDMRKLAVYSADGTWREYPDVYTQTSLEGYYIDETGAFLQAIRGQCQWAYSLSDDQRVLRLLAAAEESAEKGRHITVRQ